MENDERRIRVRLDADYYASPLWIYDEYLADYVNTPLDSFPLSDELKSRLAAWAAVFDRLPETGYEFSTESAEHDFEREGRLILAAVRAELDSSFVVDRV